jgi:hypothetical protein
MAKVFKKSYFSLEGQCVFGVLIFVEDGADPDALGHGGQRRQKRRQQRRQAQRRPQHFAQTQISLFKNNFGAFLKTFLDF